MRDLLMGRPLDDVDMVVAGDAEAAATDLARRVRGHAFSLSDRFGAWRVIDRDRRWQSDITPDSRRQHRGRPGAARLHRQRDGGPARSPASRCSTRMAAAADLDARLLRVVGRELLSRTTRCARCGCRGSPASWSSRSSPMTRTLAARHSAAIATVSPERVFYELRRLIVCDQVMRGLELMDEAGLVAELLPELEQLKGVRAEPVPPSRRLGAHAGGAGGHAGAGARPREGSRRARRGGDGRAGEAARRRPDARAGAAAERPPARHRQAPHPHGRGRARDVPRPRRGRRGDDARAAASACEQAARLRTTSRTSPAIICGSDSSYTSSRCRGATSTATCGRASRSSSR